MNDIATNNNNTLIVALAILASVVIAAIVALAIFGSPDNAVVAGATGQIITVVTLISGILVTLKVSSDAKNAAIESKAVSVENAMSIASTSQQQAHALEGVNQKVDGHLTALTRQVEQLMITVSRLEKEKAVTAVETAAIIQSVATAVPGAPPVGGTPPYGTPVVEAPIMVVAPKGPQS